MHDPDEKYWSFYDSKGQFYLIMQGGLPAINSLCHRCSIDIIIVLIRLLCLLLCMYHNNTAGPYSLYEFRWWRHGSISPCAGVLETESIPLMIELDHKLVIVLNPWPLNLRDTLCDPHRFTACYTFGHDQFVHKQLLPHKTKDVVTHPCHNFNGGVKLWYGWVVSCHREPYIWSHTHA